MRKSASIQGRFLVGCFRNTVLFSAKRHSPVTVKVHQSSVCKEAQEGDLSKVCADCGNVYGGPFPPLL